MRWHVNRPLLKGVRRLRSSGGHEKHEQVAAKSAADEVKRLKAEQREAREREAQQRKVEKEIAKALEKEEKAKATREANAAAQLAKEDAAIVR